MKNIFCAGLAIPALALGLMAGAFPDPPAASINPAASGTAKVVLAGGCFWGMQGVYEHVKGVTNTVVGYAGGKKATAHYETVSSGNTGHAESIEITYDPSKVSYGQLLKIYFSVAHDPTTLNRQHQDVGTQYRSSVFFANEEQKQLAADYIRELDAAHVYKNPIVTRVTALDAFYPAEEEHQHFMARNPSHPYIMNVDVPIFEAFKKNFPDLYRK